MGMVASSDHKNGQVEIRYQSQPNEGSPEDLALHSFILARNRSIAPVPELISRKTHPRIRLFRADFSTAPGCILGEAGSDAKRRSNEGERQEISPPGVSEKSHRYYTLRLFCECGGGTWFEEVAHQRFLFRARGWTSFPSS